MFFTPSQMLIVIEGAAVTAMAMMAAPSFSPNHMKATMA